MRAYIPTKTDVMLGTRQQREREAETMHDTKDKNADHMGVGLNGCRVRCVGTAPAPGQKIRMTRLLAS
jgi:hypothetical protein